MNPSTEKERPVASSKTDPSVRVSSISPDECILKCRGWTISIACPPDKNILWKNLKVVVDDVRVPNPNEPGVPLRKLEELSTAEWLKAKKVGLSAILNARKRAQKAAEEKRQSEREPKFL